MDNEYEVDPAVRAAQISDGLAAQREQQKDFLKVQEIAKSYFEKNKDLEPHIDLVMLEYNSSPTDPIGDYYGEKKLEAAGRRVRERLSSQAGTPRPADQTEAPDTSVAVRSGGVSQDDYAKLQHDAFKKTKAPWQD